MIAATNRLLPPASYDAAGNLTGWGSGQDAFQASWDALSQMRSLQGLGVNRRLAYDAGGERILVREVNLSPAVYTLTLRDLGGKVLREVTYTPSTGSWAWRKDYVWRDGHLLASVSASEGLRHYHLDHLGSPRLLTDRCGERLAAWQLWPFGLDPQGQAGGSGQHPERMRFTGHERDLHLADRASDDLDYMHARYYSPLLARFLSVGPVRGKPRLPQSFNLYAYAYNNPLRFVDPLGLAARLAKTPDCQTDDCIQVIGQDPDAEEKARRAQQVMLHLWWMSLQRGSPGDLRPVPSHAVRPPLAPAHVNAGFAADLVGEAATNEWLAYLLYGPEGVPGLEPVGGPVEFALLGFGGGIAEMGARGIGGVITGYTSHGLAQAIARDGVGVAPRAILDAVRNPLRIVPQSGARLMYVGPQAVVVVNAEGKVITLWARTSAAWRLGP